MTVVAMKPSWVVIAGGSRRLGSLPHRKVSVSAALGAGFVAGAVVGGAAGAGGGLGAKGVQFGRRLGTGHRGTAGVPPFADCLQHPAVAVMAVSVASLALTWLDQRVISRVRSSYSAPSETRGESISRCFALRLLGAPR